MDKLTQELRAAEWTKSSRSGSNGGNCVEVARLSDVITGIRDSKYPNGPALIFTTAAWHAFMGEIKGGSFS